MPDNSFTEVPISSQIDNTVVMNDKSVTTEEVKKEIDPVEASAIYIHQSHKHFRRMLKELGKNATDRIFEAVLFEPLEKAKLSNKREEQFVAFCNQILYNKSVLMEDILEKHSQKLKKEGEKNGSEEN